MTVVHRGYESVKAIPQNLIDEQHIGKWYSKSRIFIYKEEEKFTVIRAEWYERILAAFLKIFGHDYFAKIFNGKTCKTLSSEEVDAALKLPDAKPILDDDPSEPSAESKKMMTCWEQAVAADPEKDIKPWMDFMQSMRPVIKEWEGFDRFPGEAVYLAILKECKISPTNLRLLYLALSQQNIEQEDQIFLRLLRTTLRGHGEVFVLINNERKPFSLQALKTLISFLESQKVDISSFKKSIDDAFQNNQEIDLGDGQFVNLLDAMQDGSLWKPDQTKAQAFLTALFAEYNVNQTSLFRTCLKNVIQNMPKDVLRSAFVQYVNTPVHVLLPNEPAGTIPQPLPNSKPKEEDILKELNAIDDVIYVDIVNNWSSWKEFFAKCESGVKQMKYTIEDAGKIFKHILNRVQSVEDRLRFYHAATKAGREPNNVLTRQLADWIGQVFREQGYIICWASKGKDQPAVPRHYPMAALKVLNTWYTTCLQKTLRGLDHEILKGLKPNEYVCNYSGQDDFDEMMKPLNDLFDIRNNDKNYQNKLDELLKNLLKSYENEPTEALKFYLKMLIERSDEGMVKYLNEFPNKNSPAFLLFGECLIQPGAKKAWLAKLYEDQINAKLNPVADPKVNSSPAKAFEGYCLDAALWASVEPMLTERFIGDSEVIKNLFRSPEGRRILSCMWLQMKDEVLVKLIPHISEMIEPWLKFGNPAPLPDVLEEFAKDESRIAKYPKECDQLLVELFKLRSGSVKHGELSAWLQSSHWATLQNRPELPNLKKAYQAKCSK